MRGRRVGEGEDMTREESYGRAYENRGKEELGGRKTVVLVWIFWFCCWVL
jgi:hypothetical protein